VADADEVGKLGREPEEWLRATAERFHREQRAQEETKVFNGFALRLVMAPHPVHGNLELTAYSFDMDAFRERFEAELFRSPPTLFFEEVAGE